MGHAERVCQRRDHGLRCADGAGLAAPQIGVAKRIMIFGVESNPRYPEAESVPTTVLINPEFEVTDLQAQGFWEGCLSVPGYYEEVERAEHIRVRFLDRDGNEQEMEAEGLLAVCIQHEMDHLEGKLFVDYLSETKRQRIRKKLEKNRRHAAVVM